MKQRWIMKVLGTALLALTFTLKIAYGGADPFYLTLSRQGEHVQIPFYNVDGVTMNDICKNKLSDCKGYRAYKEANKRKQIDSSWKKKFASPADYFCNQSGGVTLILRDQTQNEMSMCAFDDKSIVSAWSLFQGDDKHP